VPQAAHRRGARPPRWRAETQRVVAEFGNRARIPGFRQGKVPAKLVRQRFAKDIEREVVRAPPAPLLAPGAGG